MNQSRRNRPVKSSETPQKKLPRCIRLALLVALASTATATHAQSIWTGAKNGDLRDADNWTKTPDGQEDIIISENGKNQPKITYTESDSYSDLSTEKDILIGTKAGSSAAVVFESKNTGQPDDILHSNTRLSANNLIVGKNKGTGSIHFSSDKNSLHYIELNVHAGWGSSDAARLIIGDGTGSTGHMSSSGIENNRFNQYVMPAKQGTSVQINYGGMTVGKSGGTGKVDVIDSTLFAGHQYHESTTPDGFLNVGSGAGSNGEINILSGGKVSTSGMDSVNPGRNSIGSQGGTGRVTVSGKNAADYSSNFVQGKGTDIGIGAGSNGQLNILSGGKNLSFYREASFQSESDALERSVVIGRNAGNGAAIVDGKDSIWYVSGTSGEGWKQINHANPDESMVEIYPPYNPDFSHLFNGSIWIGHSGNGTLQLSNGGTMEMGQAFIGGVQESFEDDYYHYYDLIDFKSGGGAIYVASEAGSTGNLIIGADESKSAVKAGNIVGAKSIEFGAGKGTLTFNHTESNYIFRTPLVGKGTLANHAGTTWLEPMLQLPAGVPVDNANFSGTTALYGGALGLGYSQALGSSRIEANGPGTLIFTDGLKVNNNATVNTGGKLSIQLAAGSTATYAGAMSGAGQFAKTGAGSLVLTGNSSALTGNTRLTGGELWVNGKLGSAGSTLTTASGTTLGGAGTIGGSASIGSGGYLLPGKQRGTPSVLTVGENLTLSAGSTSRFLFGQPGAVGGDYNDLVNVGGNLTLGGTLEVALAPGGNLMPGVYRIFNYAGTLTNNGFSLGSLPAEMGHVQMQTSIAQQVNLILTDPNGRPLLFWDGKAGPANNGKIEGGDGTWQNIQGNRFWTDANGTTNARFADGGFAVFSGAAGTVTVDDSLGPITVDGLQFLTSGYVLQGDDITLLDEDAWIRVGDSSVGRPTYVTRSPETIATLNNNLVGDARLVKTDAGTLILNGSNTQAGGTLIQSGIVQIAKDAALGKQGVELGFGTGALRTTSNLKLQRDITSNGQAVFLTASGTTLTLTGTITGAGGFAKGETGRLIYTGNGSDMGGNTHVMAGELWVNGSLGKSGSSTTVDSGALLGGSGRIGGDVSIGNGATLFPGSEADVPATFTIDGKLTFAPGATLRALLGQPGVFGGAYNDLVAVGGNLVLDGTLEVGLSSTDDLTPGVYHLITYAGALDNRGLEIGTLPAELSGSVVQTSLAGQVNLVLPDPAGDPLSFWDGPSGKSNDGLISGGSGVWQAAAGNSLWTDYQGAINAGFADASFAIFGGEAGTVTVDDSMGDISVSGMQFLTDGYVIDGDSITLADAESFIRVGNSSIGRPDYVTRGPEQVATLNAELTGSGRLIKTDSGTLVLAGVNTYTGGTKIREGILEIAADTALGAGSGSLEFRTGALRTTADIQTSRSVSITNAGTFLTADDTLLQLDGQLSGAGTLVKADSGTLRINGDAGGFSGVAEVVAGTLDVTATLGGMQTNIRSGGTLTGSGTVAAVTEIHNGGVIAPRNSSAELSIDGSVLPRYQALAWEASRIGELRIDNDYRQHTGGIYRVELKPDTTSSDHLQISGKAVLDDGALLEVIRTDAAPYSVGTRYTILTAEGGLQGKFQLQGDLAASAFLSLQDSYDANHAYLGVVQTLAMGEADCSPNARAAGTGAEGMISSSPLKNTLLNQPDMASACNALSQLSGEAHASAGAAMIEDSRFIRNAISTRTAGVHDDWAAEDRDALWVEAYGSWGRFNHGSEQQRMGRDIGGVFAGVDWQAGQNAQLGLVGGYADSTFRVDHFGDRLESQDLHLAAYAAGQWDTGWKLHAGIAQTWHDIEGQRRVTMPAFTDALSSQYDATTQQVFAEVSRRLQKANTALEPYAAVAWVRLDQDAFTENGGEAALTGPDMDHQMTFGTVGFRLKHLRENNQGNGLEFTAGVGWRHLFGDRTVDRPIGLIAGSDFLIQSAPLARNSLAVDIGMEFSASESTRLGLEYAGMHGGGIEDHGAKAYVQWRF